jgi:hypothetical protein
MASDPRRAQQPYHGSPILRQPLTGEDYATLAASAIHRDVIDRALITRVAHLEGKALVNARDRGLYSGIAFDYTWPGELSIRGSRLRRDAPDIEEILTDDGRIVRKEIRKYMCAPGSANLLYFYAETPPELLADTRVNVILTEGEKKTLPLWCLANQNASEPRFLPIGLSGVWNWRGKIGIAETASGKRRTVKGPIPDLGRLPWVGRALLIAYDSDTNVNTEIQKARAALMKEMTKRGARVRYVEIPPLQELGL